MGDRESNLEVLRQVRQREAYLENGGSAWTVVYRDWRDDDSNGGQFAAFAPKHHRERALRDPAWDMSVTGGQPGFMQSYAAGRTRTTYLRYGNSEGLEPIVILQEHHGGRPEMLPQLSEEFRLYHNLWLRPDGRQLIKVDNDGNEYVAAEISHGEVRVRTKLLRQFQAGRQLDLLLFIDSVQYDETVDPATVDLDGLAEEISTPDSRISFHSSDGTMLGRKVPFSRLLGTRILRPPERKFAGVWPYDDEDERFPEFVIDEDDSGRPVRHSCDPELLANYFGENPASPHYLTPVFFRRDVLLKYYEQPEKYSVTDGYLRCARLWSVRIDNDHPEYVMVFLGDLGRDLPSAEREYWLSYNVVPTSGMSETNFRRSFLSQFVAPGAPDLRFKQVFAQFRRDWQRKFGWDLFRDPVAADEHILRRLRIPLNESQPEFEGQVLNLAKVLVDSLNEKQLGKLVTKVADEKGIAKLRRWLSAEGYVEIDETVSLLQQVQRLRSRVAAHRKGSDYEAFVADELGDDGSMWGMARLMARAIEILGSLRVHFLD